MKDCNLKLRDEINPFAFWLLFARVLYHSHRNGTRTGVITTNQIIENQQGRTLGLAVQMGLSGVP